MKDPNRDFWSSQQKKLRAALDNSQEFEQGIQLFLEQHAMVHSASMSQSGLISFEDDVLQDVSEESFRRIPANEEHSIAWALFHIARIEDVTMNMLVAGTRQVFEQDDWQKKLNVNIIHTANAMSLEEVIQLSRSVDFQALLDYRRAVGRRTREVIAELKVEDIKQKVEPARIKNLMESGTVLEEARSIADYWSKRTTAGLLLMPPTRHNFVHLNEITNLKAKKN